MATSESHPPEILVTGAYGLLGSRVVPFLSDNTQNCKIIAVGRSERQAQADVSDSQVSFVHGDLRDKQTWARLPPTITHVVHLAAVIPWKAEERYEASLVIDNLLPIANLLERSQDWPNLQQIIYSSSVSVYAPTNHWLSEDSSKGPTNLYGAAKLAGEELLRTFDARNVRTVSLRFSSLYGYGQYEGTVLPIMARRARQKQDLLVFADGTRTQDFLHCEDAARAILLSFQKQARGNYNVGTGTPVTMSELAETVNRVFADGQSRIVYQSEKADSDPGIKLDVSKARRELNYEPLISLEHGLQMLKQEMKETPE
ncbi:MAG TPA: NAD(P)-dependent oxidoreductase [Pyrinomonadaceae bacterium]|jgi:UDP-glucose 4-epimerase